MNPPIRRVSENYTSVKMQKSPGVSRGFPLTIVTCQPRRISESSQRTSHNTPPVMRAFLWLS